MKFSEEFISAVKKEYPDSEEIHKLLEKGSFSLGKYLNEKRLEISAEYILEIFKDGNLEMIRKAAEKRLRQNNLLAEWDLKYKEEAELEKKKFIRSCF